MGFAMRWFARSFCLSLFVVSYAPALAQRPPHIETQIRMIFTGWNAEQFGILTVAPAINPAKCPLSDGYATDISQPGYYTYYAAALLAFAERATVIVVVAEEGCIADRPKLIGLNVVRSAQSTNPKVITQVRMSLAQRSLWGRDYAALIASIPGWARIQEKTIVIAPDVVFGGTPFRSREEAETHAERLAAALEQPEALAPNFEHAAVEGRRALAGKIAARPYSGGESYRVVLGVGSNFLPELTIADVQRILGKEEAIRSETEEVGDGRPIVYTAYVYFDGTVIFKSSNYAPRPDQVVQVVLDISSSLEAIGGTR
jgi:hypothetical protein